MLHAAVGGSASAFSSLPFAASSFFESSPSSFICDAFAFAGLAYLWLFSRGQEGGAH
jgi:hypothetical protein